MDELTEMQALYSMLVSERAAMLNRVGLHETLYQLRVRDREHMLQAARRLRALASESLRNDPVAALRQRAALIAR